MYSYKERETAVKLYIKYGRRAVRVIKELGYEKLTKDQKLFLNNKNKYIRAHKNIFLFAYKK